MAETVPGLRLVVGVHVEVDAGITEDVHVVGPAKEDREVAGP